MAFFSLAFLQAMYTIDGADSYSLIGFSQGLFPLGYHSRLIQHRNTPEQPDHRTNEQHIAIPYE